jgi:hypothetical protein
MALIIDPANAQFAGRDGSGRISVMMPRALMTRQEALTHAAWLVALADDDDEFGTYLSAIRGT